MRSYFAEFNLAWGNNDTLYSLLSSLAMVWIKLCSGLVPVTLPELDHCEGMLRGLSAAAPYAALIWERKEEGT